MEPGKETYPDTNNVTAKLTAPDTRHFANWSFWLCHIPSVRLCPKVMSQLVNSCLINHMPLLLLRAIA